MKYFTDQKKKSHPQGHRRRRRKISISTPEAEPEVSWSEYKTIRQYQSLGDVLDEFKIYGFAAGVEHILEKNMLFERDNGHYWLTSDKKK
ncbi:MAG: hypothetical protein ACE5DW_00645 [Thermodesulfobacteriota bacterium]